MRAKTPTLEVVIGVLLLALIAGGFALGGSSGTSSAGSATAGARAAAAEVAPIARRVESIRGLRFTHIPKPVIVSADQTRRDALHDLDRQTSAEEQRVGAQVLELLGLLKPGVNLRAVQGDVAGEQVAGYYDTKRKRLAIVAGAGAADDVTSEITLAHELDHALDDQRIGLKDVASTGADDAASAYTALVEGVATSVMDDYARRYIDPGRAFSSALSSAGPALASTKNIPPYLLASILFSYTSGERFVNRLRAAAHSWKLVNYALRTRPPRTTEQIIHPEKYFVDERAVPVAALGVGALLPRGWRRAARGTVGEFDTDQLLKLGTSDAVAGDAAAGWGGGAYVLWVAPRSSSCAAPCRRDSALVLSWAWDTPHDAAQFDQALGAYLANGLHARPAGTGTWAVGDGFSATRSIGAQRTILTFAPSAALARRLTLRTGLSSTAAGG